MQLVYRVCYSEEPITLGNLFDVYAFDMSNVMVILV